MQISLCSNHISNKASTVKTLAKLIHKKCESVSLKDNRGLAGGQGRSQTEISVFPPQAESLVARRFWMKGEWSKHHKDSPLCQTEFDATGTSSQCR